MPIYEYRCRSCDGKFAHLHRRADEKAPDCPTCGAAEPRKLFSVFSAKTAANVPSCSLGKCPSGGSCKSGECPLG